MSQAIRFAFTFFSGSQTGGTGPTQNLVALFSSATGAECSDMVFCTGLTNKAIEIGGNANDLNANHVVIEGTISEYALDKSNWFPVSPVITAPGIFTLIVAAAANIFYEPELTHLRIRAINEQVPPGVLPQSINAAFGGFWQGDGLWTDRLKYRFGESGKYSSI